MKRRFPEYPMVGVGALIFRDQQVLLVRRGKEPAYGKWSLPGGLVEVGESLEQAVRREVREEVGLTVRVVDLVAALDRVIRIGQERVEYHYVLLDFWCRSESGQPVAGSDAMGCSFIPIEDLESYSMTEGTAEVIRRVWDRAHERPVHPVYMIDR